MTPPDLVRWACPRCAFEPDFEFSMRLMIYRYRMVGADQAHYHCNRCGASEPLIDWLLLR